MLRVIYAFFVGILLALFVGAGIAAFYPSPTAPQSPDIGYVGKEGPNQQQEAQQKAFERSMDEFNKNQMNPYNRNVSIIALIAAIIFVSLGLLLEERIDVLADGALLGGLFTLLYSIGRGFAAQDDKYSFVVVSVGLVIVLGLGYLRFIRPESTKAQASQRN